MVIINNAILHVLDFNSDVIVYSKEALELNSEAVFEFLSKHVSKSLENPNLKFGTFHEDSEMKGIINSYLTQETSFIDTSTIITEKVHDIVSKMDELESMDLLVLDFKHDEVRYAGFILFSNKIGYTHQVSNVNGAVRSEIIRHYALLPSPAQKIDTFAFVSTETGEVKFSDKKRKLNGEDRFLLPELILKCTSSVSTKDTVKTVKKIAAKIAEENGANSTAAVSTAKNAIFETAEASDQLEPGKLGEEIFKDSKRLQEEFASEMRKEGIPSTVKVNQTYAMKAAKTHKIKTDTGIEITFPVDYFDNQEYIEFTNNPNGTISIQVKNVGKIINR